MSSTASLKVITPQNLEDWLSSAPAAIALFNIDPRISFILLVAIGSIAKAIAGITAWPSKNSWQDWALLVAAGFSAASTVANAPEYYAVYALAFGLFAKGIADIVQKNFEDVVLVALSLVSIILQATGHSMDAMQVLAFAQIIKALPGIFGAALTATEASAKPASTPPTAPAQYYVDPVSGSRVSIAGINFAAGQPWNISTQTNPGFSINSSSNDLAG
jgi:hypothetical protein